MAFRIETTTRALRTFIVCEGHLDAEAVAAIERGWEAANVAGQDAVITVRRGATADRLAVARLAAFPAERLEVESPFLRLWLEEVRAARARAAESVNEEHRGSRSDTR
jgi:hypothetical protein